MNKYNVYYESLVFNLPLSKTSNFMGHILEINCLSKEMENHVISKENPLILNHSFLNCCYSFDGSTHQYVKMKNIEALCFEFEEELNDSTVKYIVNEVTQKILNIEKYILFITNSHIFFPVTQTIIYDHHEKVRASNIHCRNKQITNRRWLREHETINLGIRTGYHFEQSLFESFLQNKARYSRAFDYYIDSFYESNHASAFCMLCAAIDSITGMNGANMTKKRLAKYSSVLFCAPLNATVEEEKMRQFYSLRSKYVHGQGNFITEEDEFSLREYVRKFLFAYYLFWNELKIKNEPQMLQILDKIYEKHSLYAELVPASYSFIALIAEHEKLENGLFSLTLQEKYNLAVTKMAEAIISKKNSQSYSVEKNPK